MREWYAQVVMKVEPGGEDAALFLDGKVSSALAHDMVAWRSDDALARAAGSQQGRTAGHGFGQDLTFMGDRLGWPIDTSRIDSAAPPPTALPRKKAGTMPLDARVQVEHVAAGGTSAEQWAALGHEPATPTHSRQNVHTQPRGVHAPVSRKRSHFHGAHPTSE